MSSPYLMYLGRLANVALKYPEQQFEQLRRGGLLRKGIFAEHEEGAVPAAQGGGRVGADDVLQHHSRKHGEDVVVEGVERVGRLPRVQKIRRRVPLPHARRQRLVASVAHLPGGWSDVISISVRNELLP